MKFRNGFVTNSSSSSFLISKKDLSPKQLDGIRYHSELGKKLNLDNAEQKWSIEENDTFITGYTALDNFFISDLFVIMNIPSQNIKWNSWPFDLNSPQLYKLWKKEVKVSQDWEKALEEVKNGNIDNNDDLDEILAELSK